MSTTTMRQRDFNDLAEKRYANIVATGKTIPWNEMRAYLESRQAGKTCVARPTWHTAHRIK